LRFIINQPYYSEAVKQKREGSSYDQSLDVLLDIAYSRFKNLEIGQFCYNVVSKAILLGRKEQGLSPAIPRIDLAEKLSLEEQFEAIDHLKASEFGATRAGVNYGNFRGALDLQFDPHLETNLPYALYHIPKEVFDSKFDQVDVLRFGTPTRSGEVIEEFKAFLQALQFKGEKHLYVNMQHFDEGAAKFNRSLKSLPYLGYWFAGSHHMLKGDNMRSFAIHELQEEFGDAFVFVSLAQDSSFYHQKEGPWMYETSIAFQEFAQEFFNQFENLKGLSGIYLPEILKTDLAFMQKAKDLMSEVHKALFEAKPNLSKQERKDFIEIYYAFFELMLIKTLNISSMNIACKDAIDRAGKSNALLFKLLSLVNGDRDESVKEKSFVAITHGPAFLVKKQAILEHRRERLVSAIKYFEKPTARESVEGVFDFMELRYSEDSLGDKRVKVVFDEADQAI
jgi:hypothetical protein